MVIRPRPRMTMSTLPLPYPLIPSPLPYLRLPSFPPPNPSRPAPLPEKSNRTSTNTVTRLLRGAQNTKTPQNNTTKRKPKTTVYNTSIHKHTYKHKTLPWYTKKNTHTHAHHLQLHACHHLYCCVRTAAANRYQQFSTAISGCRRLPTGHPREQQIAAHRSKAKSIKSTARHSTAQRVVVRRWRKETHRTPHPKNPATTMAVSRHKQQEARKKARNKNRPWHRTLES